MFLVLTDPYYSLTFPKIDLCDSGEIVRQIDKFTTSPLKGPNREGLIILTLLRERTALKIRFSVWRNQKLRFLAKGKGR